MSALTGPQSSNPTSGRMWNVVLYHRHLSMDSWWAESPELPNWTAAAETLEECQQLAKDAFKFFRGLA